MKTKSRSAKGDLGSGFAGPAGKITDDPNEEIEPYKEYPWSPKGKRGLPFDAPEAPKITDYGFPFKGKNLERISFNRNEERVNKNPNKNPTRFLRRVGLHVQAKQQRLFFPDFLEKVKLDFKEIKLVFPKPPTYIWNPAEKDAKLDVKKIKDTLRVRFPTLTWSFGVRGIEMSQVKFPDMTYADLAIGQDANQLTITYHIEGDVGGN